jgi:hypothetical protein
LSTLALAVIFYFARILFVAIFKGLMKLTKDKFCTKKIFILLKKGMFFNFIISVFLEGYFEFTVNGYINL